MILALLLLAWTWDRVFLNCQGGPETMGHYYFQATVFHLWPSICCCDEQGQDYDCTVMLPAEPIRFGPDFPDPGVGASVSTTADPVEDPNLLPTPPVGGFVAWPWVAPVVAVDAAGNKSGSCP